MKAKLLLTLLLSFSFYLLSSQVPQGFNYQAMATDAAGNPLKSTTLQVKLSILSDTIVPTIIWEELHSVVKTKSNGVFSIVLGSGVRQTNSAVASFSAINWKTGSRFIKTQIFYQNTWKSMGSAKMWTVPYAMVADNFSGSMNKLAVKGIATNPDSALFEVKNNTGQTVFAVYSEGVRVFVDDGNKGSKGGFSIGGFGTDKAAKSQPYFKVYRDSTRILVKDAAKGAKGGFSIGGFTNAKGNSGNFLDLTPNNYFIGQNSGKNNTTGLYNSFVGYKSGNKNTSGSSNTFFGDSTGLNNTSGSYNVFMGKDAGFSNINSKSNVYIGEGAGKMAKHTPTIEASWNVAIGTLAGYYNNGIYNVFLGQESGYNNERGSQNVFIGTGAGYYNDTASYNIAIGTSAGYNNMGTAGVFIGNFAGFSNEEASFNVLIGNNAGQATTTGEKNVVLGSDAGYANTTGTYNTFLGNLSGADNISGGWNIYVGNSAGEHATGNYNTVMGNVAGRKITSDYNTMIGFQSGIMTTSGSGNAFFGHQSGHENISGTHNTYLGPSAGYYNTAGSANVMIGYEAGAYEYGSNKLVIANSSSAVPSSSSLIYGDFSLGQIRFNTRVGINSAPSLSYNLYISGSAYSTVGFFIPSDIRLKQNVKSMEGDGVIDKVKEMQVIKYNYTDVITKGDPALDTKFIGVVAQDIEAAFPEAVKTDANGYKAVSINALTGILLQAIKDQQKEIDLLKSEVELLKAKK
jgi:hypothetical protein